MVNENDISETGKYNDFSERIDTQNKFINRSDGYPINITFNSKGLLKYIMLPDFSPIRGTPGVGTVTVFDSYKHEFVWSYLGRDIGCGILLGKFKTRPASLEKTVETLMANGKKSKMSSLVGKGNHFINIYEDILNSDDVYAVVHTNGKFKTNSINLLNKAIFEGKSKRMSVLKNLQELFDEDIFPVEDYAHNTFEVIDKKAIYRKGAVKITPNKTGFITSSFNGEAIIFKTTQKIKELENSICHGTGRVMPLSECVDNREAFRGLWRVEELLAPYINITNRLRPLGVDDDYVYELQRKAREVCETLTYQEIRQKAFDICTGQRKYFGNKYIKPIGEAEDKFILAVALTKARRTINYLSNNKSGFIELGHAFEREAILKKALND